MRNPERIEPFLDMVKKVWIEKCPDWRFGQFITNIFDAIGPVAFYLEEPEMLEAIENYFKVTEEIKRRKEDKQNGK